MVIRFALLIAALSASAQFGPVIHRRAAFTGGGLWADTNYAKRISVSIPASIVDSTLSAPVLIDLANAPSSLHAAVETDGDDIRVYKDDHSTELAIELVAIDTTAETGQLWTYHDSINSTDATVVFLYYDYSSATAYANPQDVWDSTGADYMSVWHMDSPGDGDQDNALGIAAIDADHVNTDSGDSVAGKVGKTIDFDGAGEYYTVPTTDAATYLRPDSTGSFDFWLYADDLNDRMLFEYGDSNSKGIGFWNWAGYYRPIIGDSTANVYTNLTKVDTSTSTATWYHVAVTWDGTNAKFYWDGSEIDTYGFTSSITWFSTDFRLGKWSTSWNGRIDEFRLHDSAHSADYISFQYEIMNDNTQLTWGTEETQ